MSESLVDIEDLHFARGDRKIFDGVSFSIKSGSITAVMGPSGSGKTTLLKLIGGALRPEQGKVFFDGQQIFHQGRKNLYRLRQRMGLLFQSGALFTDLSVYENVAFPLRIHTDLPEIMIRDLVLMKLECVGLRGAHELMPAQLSGGMARRAALARSIALDPDLIMYDEPFAGQDPISMGILLSLIQRLSAALRLTSIIVSHDVTETLRIADYAYVIAQGKIIGAGTPTELQHSDSALVQQFLQGNADGPVKFHYPTVDYAVDLRVMKDHQT